MGDTEMRPLALACCCDFLLRAALPRTYIIMLRQSVVLCKQEQVGRYSHCVMSMHLLPVCLHPSGTSQHTCFYSEGSLISHFQTLPPPVLSPARSEHRSIGKLEMGTRPPPQRKCTLQGPCLRGTEQPEPQRATKKVENRTTGVCG